MYMKIYDEQKNLVAEGDVSTEKSGLASNHVIFEAVDAGYDVIFEGLIYHSPDGETGKLAFPEIND